MIKVIMDKYDEEFSEFVQAITFAVQKQAKEIIIPVEDDDNSEIHLKNVNGFWILEME